MRKIGIMLLSCVLLSGCLKGVELKDRGIVQSIGVDYDGTSYQVNMQIFSSSAGEGGSAFDKGKQNNKVIAGKGKTLHAAIREAGNESGKMMFLGNLKVIIIGDKTAQRGIKNIVDYFDSDFQTRGKTKILISEGEAKEIITAKSDKDKIISADDINDMLKANTRTGYVGRSNILSAETSFYNTTPNGFLLNRIKLVKEGEKKRAVIEGAALMQGDKMVDTLTKEEVHGSSWLKNNMQWAIITAKEPELGDFSVTVKSSQNTITPKINGEQLEFYIEVDFSANLIEVVAKTQGKEEGGNMETLQKATEAQVEKEITMAIQKSIYKNKCDIFSLNKYVKQWNSPYVKEIGDNWGEVLQNSQIFVKANCNIKRTMLSEKIR